MEGKSIVRKCLAVEVLLLFVAAGVPYLSSAQMFSSHQHNDIHNAVYTPPSLIYREPGPLLYSRLYADGSILDLQTESVTWPILLNEKTEMTQEDFKNLMTSAKNIFDKDTYKIIRTGDSRGLDIQFEVYYPPGGAQAAINAAASYIESVFSDPITVVIFLGFDSMGQGVLGGTSCSFASSVSWVNTRTGLITDMDADDTIQTYLPSGSSIPVRYNGNSGTVTNEDECYFSIANYCAAIGSASGEAAFTIINTDYTWDYDPSDGITPGSFCFQSVLIHEVGHVLGFLSGADFGYEGIFEALDIYRFQLSDGSGDYNPDTLAEFQTTARMVDQNAPGTSDDVVTDIISKEYQMSDGVPYQCSHFSQNFVYALMQPAISSGDTYYPHFYQSPDLTMIDAIGWDYLRPPDTTPPVTTCKLTGTPGVNNWFVSNVTVTLHANDLPEEDPSGVNHTYYKIDSGPWNEYTGPFVIPTEGQRTLVYYSVDNAGNDETEKTSSIKIDKTTPTITLSKQQINPFTVKFTAEATDAISGIGRVDFSLDGVLQYTDTESPYEWTWTGILNYNLTATAYDLAGNAQSQSTSTPVEISQAASVHLHLIQLLIAHYLQHQSLS